MPHWATHAARLESGDPSSNVKKRSAPPRQHRAAQRRNRHSRRPRVAHFRRPEFAARRTAGCHANHNSSTGMPEARSSSSAQRASSAAFEDARLISARVRQPGRWNHRPARRWNLRWPVQRKTTGLTAGGLPFTACLTTHTLARRGAVRVRRLPTGRANPPPPEPAHQLPLQPAVRHGVKYTFTHEARPGRRGDGAHEPRLCRWTTSLCPSRHALQTSGVGRCLRRSPAWRRQAGKRNNGRCVRQLAGPPSRSPIACPLAPPMAPGLLHCPVVTSTSNISEAAEVGGKVAGEAMNRKSATPRNWQWRRARKGEVGEASRWTATANRQSAPA